MIKRYCGANYISFVVTSLRYSTVWDIYYYSYENNTITLLRGNLLLEVQIILEQRVKTVKNKQLGLILNPKKNLIYKYLHFDVYMYL